MNRDSHIASSPIWQSYFFEEARCLILASSQRKLRRYIEFLKCEVTIKKFNDSNSSKIWRTPLIFTKFSIKHHSVLVHLRTEFQLDKSKFGWVRQFWKSSQKIQNLKKFERFNRFWPKSIRVIYLCIVFGR